MTFTHIPHVDYEMHPAYGKQFGKPTFSKKIKVLKEIFPYLRSYAMQIIALKMKQTNRLARSFGVEDEAVLDRLRKDGIIAFHLRPEEKAKLIDFVQTYVEMLEKQKAAIPLDKRKFSDKVMTISRGKLPALYEEVEKILEERHIFSVAAAYRKLSHPMKLKAVHIQASDSNDPDWRNHFADINVPDPLTQYMHVDATSGDMKCLIYLTEVAEKNGPFSYLKGTNNAKMGFWEWVVRVSNDKSRLDKCTPDKREQFSALPKIFQKKAEFGNDLTDESVIADLVRHEHRFTSQDGDFIFFDNNGFHRGGMVQEKKRVIMQILLRRQ